MTEERQEYAVIPATPTPTVRATWTQDRIDLLKATICQGTTNDEFALFLEQCKRTGLDPFGRQIYAVRRYDKREQRKVMQIQISIDGARLISERTGKYGGITPPSWCDENEQWHDVWLKNTPPAAAKIGVYRTDWQHVAWGIATYREYVQVDNNNAPMGMWEKMPANQLVKCAESQAHRKAFPQELSGLYTTEEMGQADNVVDSTATDVPSPEPTKPGNSKPQPASKMWKGKAQPIEPPAKSPPVGLGVEAPPSIKPETAALPPIQSGAKIATDKDVPNTAIKLLECVNQRVLVSYNSIYHLQGAIRKELNDPGWQWRSMTDLEGWQVALDAAVKHAAAKGVAEPVPETVVLSEEMEKALNAPGE